jgi:hypothetical protein
MAIMKLANSEVGTTNSNAVVTGMDFVTEASVELSAGTVVKAKNGAGDVKAVLIGKTSYTMQASGYGSANGGVFADGTAALAAGVAFDVGAAKGKITSVSIERTAEDFAKLSVTGRALA